MQAMGTDEERSQYRVTISLSSAAEDNAVAHTWMPLAVDMEEDNAYKGLTLSDEQVSDICTQKCGSNDSEYAVTLHFKKLDKYEAHVQH